MNCQRLALVSLTLLSLAISSSAYCRSLGIVAGFEATQSKPLGYGAEIEDTMVGEPALENPGGSALAHSEEAAPRQWITFTNELQSGGTGPEMMIVDGGHFSMGCVSGVGCHDNEPVREVSIKPFAMSVYEVTRGEFRRFIEQTGYVTDAERAPKNRTWRDVLVRGLERGCLDMVAEPHGRAPVDGFTWKDPGHPQTDEHPVVCVSWADALEYVKWLAAETDRPYRLPSEAEWEYAARAGTPGTVLDEEVLSTILFCNDLRDRRKRPSKEEIETCILTYWNTQAVGDHKPNAFGLSGMTENAVEWVEDCWHRNFRSAPRDGSAWTKRNCRRYVYRVGGLMHFAAPLESRWRMSQHLSMNLLGFRIALPSSD